MTKPAISVVIPAHNEEKLLSRCLKSVLNQDFDQPYEVIVVDNASTDQTAAIAKSFAVQVIKEPRKGVAAARKAGFAAAQANIVATTDADCVVPVNWLALIWQEFFKNPEAAIFVGSYHFTDSQKAVVKVVNYALNRLPRILVTSPTGMNTAARKSAYDKTGGFDINYNLCEDRYLAKKISRLGTAVFNYQSVVLASGRRLDQPPHRLLVDVLKILITGLGIEVFNKPIFKNFRDVR